MRRRSLPSTRVINRKQAEDLGREVVLLETLPVNVGDFLTVEFLRARSDRRQGIWLGLDGTMKIGGETSSQFTIWADTAPRVFEVEVLNTEDGLLRIHNVWDSGRGMRSQTDKSGMLTSSDGSSWRFHANDVEPGLRFESLSFVISKLGRRDSH